MLRFIAERNKGANGEFLRRIRIVRGDLTRQDDVDAIVTSIMTNLDTDGPLNRALIAAAGNGFDEFILENIYKPKPGDVYVLPGFDLPVDHVIMTVLPFWKDNFDREDAYLLRCYRHAMQTAVKMNLRRIAFPALCTGRYGYPLERATRLAIRGIMERMTPSVHEVRIVCNREETYESFSKRLKRYRG